MPHTTLSQLPHDLLAHVLRFATGAARRDGQPAHPVPLAAWHLSTVSRSFRAAFLHNLTSLALTTPAAHRLAALDWRPISACPALRHIVVTPHARLSDAALRVLFHRLHADAAPLRLAEFTLDDLVTHRSVLLYASLFGTTTTHLGLTLPSVRALSRRHDDDEEPVWTELSADMFAAAVDADVQLWPAADDVRATVSTSDDVFATIVSHMPLLQHITLDGAKLVLNTGILALLHCIHLQKLVLSTNHCINDNGLAKLIAKLTKLCVLRLRDMMQIGNSTIEAICTSQCRSSLQFLELTRVGKVTDPAVKQLVNSCENLRAVHIQDCPRISCEAASHLSCARNLRDVTFKPQPSSPLTNRTSIYLSCASASLTSLSLSACKDLSLDGIVALANLPALQKLHLRGLSHVSQDIMRALSVFPRLHDLTLQGAMHLTDLGVKMLCARRGHRFLHLALQDTSKNLTDEGLDCIMTWCSSLRTLEVHGFFNLGALQRLHDCMPHTSITVYSHFDGRDHVDGAGSVWDPPREI